ncbi:imelysin family protein [Tropicibacter oceani]|uniref:Imelysin family protein n=1 Tax=Tropicibacter oceani TaxID=3058420 RepID=A0ABY8QI15_9RHOB|nr:imelysin family protein [Tropicibacter oceani]WGW04280.1 imelysin family protein [Tropicibacter oceani]
MRALILSLLITPPAMAGVPETVAQHILPGVAAFAEGTEALRQAAADDCRATALHPAYQKAFDAWMGLAHLQFGPLEQDGRSLTIAFWPDTRGLIPKTVSNLVTTRDAAALDPDSFAEVSIAGRGLFALELMLFDPTLSDYGPLDHGCVLVQAMTADLARTGQALRGDWDSFAKVLNTAGAPGNTTYLSPDEAAQTLYTALLSGLEFTEDQRLGRPLGTFDRPRPTRAEARRSGRSLRNVVLSLTALHDLARHLSDQPIPRTDAAFETALSQAKDLDDATFDGVSDPAARLKIEVLQQSIGFVRDAIQGEIGSALGLTAGFNSQDGD